MSADQDLVRKSAALWWPNLPTLLGGSIMVAASWAILRGLPGGGLLPLLGIALLVLPLQSALVDLCATLLDDEHTGVVRLVRRFPATCVRTWRVAVPVGAVAVATSAAGTVWARGGQHWMLVSWVVCWGALAGITLVGTVALPYAIRSGDTWREVWLVGAYLASRSPLIVLGVLAACGLTVWAAAHLSFALLLLLPAPLALVWAAGAAEATRRGRHRLDTRTRASV